ncbi:hypothetical protein [Acinetobacter sp. c1-l78]|uniref:hypothetical protein n=1 Tax=Acinetobacter sp. c1-l78 TaxID=3342803 RepID=UPI0035B7372A
MKSIAKKLVFVPFLFTLSMPVWAETTTTNTANTITQITTTPIGNTPMANLPLDSLSVPNLQGLDSADLQASLDLYKAQINQENIITLTQVLQQQVARQTQSKDFEKGIQQGVGIVYDAEQAKAMTDFAQKQLPQLIEKNSPMFAQQVEKSYKILIPPKSLKPSINPKCKMRCKNY